MTLSYLRDYTRGKGVEHVWQAQEQNGGRAPLWLTRLWLQARVYETAGFLGIKVAPNRLMSGEIPASLASAKAHHLIWMRERLFLEGMRQVWGRTELTATPHIARVK
jgi:hypothetical protein